MKLLLMIILNILQKKPLKEILYWVAEYLYSGYDAELWELLFKCYYDFYALANPTLEYALITKYCKWLKNKDETLIILFIKTLAHKKYDCDVFTFRMKYNSLQKMCDETKYRGRKPKWLHTYDGPYKNFIYSISKQNDTNVMHYIKKYTYDELYNPLITYYTSLNTNKSYTDKMVKIWNKLNDIHLNNLKPHILMYIYKCIITEKSRIYNKSFILKPSPKTILNFKNYKTIKPIITNKMSRPYKILRTYREYGVNPLIGCFKLMRFTIDNIHAAIWYHWEYYAYTNKQWFDLFTLYGGVINHTAKKNYFL